MVLLLEDDLDRIRGFRGVIARLDPALEIVQWRSARVMACEIGEYLGRASLLSLDHDLLPDADGVDPGDGLELAKFLVSQRVVRPVIVHSSNGERATRMVGEFELAGWPVSRVLPLGETWIEDDWRMTAEAVLCR